MKKSIRSILLVAEYFVFILTIFLFPVNLGKHFEFPFSYVGGLLVDYLVPTIFLPDILVLVLLFLWILNNYRDFKKILLILLKSKVFALLVLFFAALLFSVLDSNHTFVSLTIFTRMFLYFGFSVYLCFRFLLDTKTPIYLTNTTKVSFLLLFILGAFQFVIQKSVFDNYLFFGEQPYSVLTPLITKKVIFGKEIIPPYGLFRHPNTFAGAICLIMTWIFCFGLDNRKRFNTLFFSLGFIVMLFTLSRLAIFAFLVGIILVYLIRRYGSGLSQFTTSATTLFIALSLTWPLFVSYNQFSDASVYRRGELVKGVLDLVTTRPLFGLGIGTSLYSLEDAAGIRGSVRFVQPVHNIFALVAVEGGIIALGLFIVLFVYILSQPYMYGYPYAAVLLIQTALLGSFDHYLLTSHQTLFFLFMIFGFLMYMDIKRYRH